MNRIIALPLLALLLVASPLHAQQSHVVDSTTLSQALASRNETQSAQRALLERVLERDDASEIAARMGMSVERARSAIATLSAGDLDALAQHAAAVESATRAGGASTIVISTTTLLLILIIVILLAK